MACRGCSEQAKPPGEAKTFTFPLNGVHLELVTTGTLTPENIVLVKQALAVSYDLLEGMAQADPVPAPRPERGRAPMPMFGPKETT
jgi:hypothetical protein